MRIAPGLNLPIELAGESTAILAKKGAGKSNTAKVIVEETLDHGGVQVIVLDPIGHWWSLRAGADGKPRGGYPVAVFGGMHGDLPLEETAGKLIAQTAVESGQSMVLDVSGLDSNGAMQRFVYDLLEELYRLKQAAPTPLLLVLEEADEFAPQDPKGTNVPRMVGAANRISKRGRGRGIGLLYVTQRSAALNKNVLDQADTLIVMRTMGPRDRKAIEDWVKHQDAEGMDEVLPSLPSLATGEAWVWSPTRGLLERVRVRKARTYDSSWTPRPGDAQVVVDVKPIDVAALGERMRATVEQIKANDPSELRKRVRQLEREIAERPTEQKVERVVEQVPVEVPVLDDEKVELLQAIVGELRDIAEATGALRAVADQIESALRGATAKPAPVRTPPAPRTPERVIPRPRPASRPVEGADSESEHVKAGARRIVETLARHYPMLVTRAQLGTLTGFKITGGTFQTYFSQLKRLGLIVEQDGEIAVTDDGIRFSGVDVGDPMTTEEVLERWRGALKAGARQMLDVLVGLAGEPVSKEELAERVGMTVSGGTFQTYLSTLRRNGLADVAGGEVRASESLFVGSNT